MTKLHCGRVGNRHFFLASLTLFCSLVSILFRNFRAPACTKLISGPLSSSVLINCDSAQFMQDSQYPSRILAGLTSYQDRPLYALVVHLIAKPLSIFFDGSETFPNARGEPIEFFYVNYLVFIALNFAVLIFSVYLLSICLPKLGSSGVNPSSFNYLFTAIFSLVFLNDIIKGFFWTPHSQMFHLLLVSLSLFSLAFFSQQHNKQRTFLWFALVSCLIFFYPIMIILLAIPVSKNFRKFFLPALASGLPYLIYPKVIEALGGTFRFATTSQYRQFVWLFDVRHIDELQERFFAFIHTFPRALTCLTLILMSILLTSLRSRGSTLDWVYPKFLIMYFLFLYAMGFYATRITTAFLIACSSYFLIFVANLNFQKTFRVLCSSVTLFCILTFFLTEGSLS